MKRKKPTFPYETDILTPEAIAAAKAIYDCKTEESSGIAFANAHDALVAAWDNNDSAAKEHWRLVFSAYIRFFKRKARWMGEYHDLMSAGIYAHDWDPRYVPHEDEQEAYLMDVSDERKPAGSVKTGLNSDIDDDIPF